MAIDREKTDPMLGEMIHKHLTMLQVETPILRGEHSLNGEKQKQIEKSFREIMTVLNLDLKDDSLQDTPKRVAKMYLKEVFGGLDYQNFPRIMAIENKMGYDSMLVERRISVKSMCEHHFVPIIGEAFVAYIPDAKVIGLSKINRIVEFFSRRPQVQERLVEQIYGALSYILETDSVAVMIKADHLCVQLRGVEDVNSDTITTKLGGAFLTGVARNEFLQSINL